MFEVGPESSDPADDRAARPAGEIVRRLIPILGVHWRILALAAALSLVVSLLWLIPPVLISRIIDRAILGGDRQLLATLTAAIVGVALVIVVLDIVQSYFVTLLGERFVRTVKVMLFESLQLQSHRFFIRTSPGAIASRLFNDVSGIQMAVSFGLLDILGAVLFLSCILVFMFVWNWVLALLCVAFLPVVFCVSFVLGRMNRDTLKRLFAKHEEIGSFVFGRLNINGFVLLNGFGYDKTLDSGRFGDGATDVMRLSIRQRTLMNGVSLTFAVLPVLISAAIYFYGGLEVIGGELTLGVLTAFITLSMMLMSPVMSLANTNVNLIGSLALFDRIFEWIDLEPEVVDSPTARDLPVTRGRVGFRDVCFEYDDGFPVLRGLSFDAEPGQLLALVGPSGAGKTTVTHLMLRFYDPTSGSIELDGHDLREYRLAALRRHTSIVPQESTVLNGSARENLLIAKPAATDDDLIAACEAAQLHDLLQTLPDGLDTELGEFGYRFSGGERQRLAIARAVLKQPKLLIMDEPTSALDSITEAAIREALATTLRESTTIVIAHRLSTILAAEKILVLDGGRCVDVGGHRELLGRCHLYRRLYEEQFATENAG